MTMEKLKKKKKEQKTDLVHIWAWMQVGQNMTAASMLIHYRNIFIIQTKSHLLATVYYFHEINTNMNECEAAQSMISMNDSSET